MHIAIIPASSYMTPSNFFRFNFFIVMFYLHKKDLRVNDELRFVDKIELKVSEQKNVQINDRPITKPVTVKLENLTKIQIEKIQKQVIALIIVSYYNKK